MDPLSLSLVHGLELWKFPSNKLDKNETVNTHEMVELGRSHIEVGSEFAWYRGTDERRPGA